MVSDEKSLRAMSGDKVNYIVCRKRRKGGDTEAEIVEITNVFLKLLSGR